MSDTELKNIRDLLSTKDVPSNDVNIEKELTKY
jgi:hypothetical protein